MGTQVQRGLNPCLAMLCFEEDTAMSLFSEEGGECFQGPTVSSCPQVFLLGTSRHYPSSWPSVFPAPSSLSPHFNWKLNCYANLLLHMPSCRSCSLGFILQVFQIFLVQKVPCKSTRLLLGSLKHDSEAPAFPRTRNSSAVVAQSLGLCLFRDRRNPQPLSVMTPEWKKWSGSYPD